jgi:hypothetical protein
MRACHDRLPDALAGTASVRVEDLDESAEGGRAGLEPQHVGEQARRALEVDDGAAVLVALGTHRQGDGDALGGRCVPPRLGAEGRVEEPFAFSLEGDDQALRQLSEGHSQSLSQRLLQAEDGGVLDDHDDGVAVAPRLGL